MHLENARTYFELCIHSSHMSIFRIFEPELDINGRANEGNDRKRT